MNEERSQRPRELAEGVEGDTQAPGADRPVIIRSSVHAVSFGRNSLP